PADPESPCAPGADVRAVVAASERRPASLVAFAPESDAPRSPCGSARATAVGAADSRNAAGAALVAAVFRVAGGGTRDPSAVRAPVPVEAYLYSAATSLRRGLAAADAPAAGGAPAGGVPAVVAPDRRGRRQAFAGERSLFAPGRETLQLLPEPWRRRPAVPSYCSPVSFCPPVRALRRFQPSNFTISGLRIRNHILLQIQIVQQLEIRIQVVVLVERL